ncbi:MAG: TIGR02466 family protein [Bdellovibrionales bacterium]
MPTKLMFPTQIYQNRIMEDGIDPYNKTLIQEIFKLSEIDEEGVNWSEENYLGGYTSYNSYNQLQNFSSSFEDLKEKIDEHVAVFMKELEFELDSEELQMSNCWANIMPTGTNHSGHIHPNSVLSGTYYLQIPEDSPSIKFEDPRLGLMMNSPRKIWDASEKNQHFVKLNLMDGDLVLFESWLRHEVPANPSEFDRISISFNYE